MKDQVDNLVQQDRDHRRRGPLRAADPAGARRGPGAAAPGGSGHPLCLPRAVAQRLLPHRRWRPARSAAGSSTRPTACPSGATTSARTTSTPVASSSELAERQGVPVPPVACFTATAKPEVTAEVLAYFREPPGAGAAPLRGWRRARQPRLRGPGRPGHGEAGAGPGHPQRAPGPGRGRARGRRSSTPPPARRPRSWRPSCATRAGRRRPSTPGSRPRRSGASRTPSSPGNSGSSVPPTPSAWGWTRRTCAWWSTWTSPAPWRTMSRRRAGPGATGGRPCASCSTTPQDVERQFRMEALSALSRQDIAEILRGLRRARHGKDDTVVLTSGELLRDEDLHLGFDADDRQADTRVRVAVAWLERSGLVERNENRTRVFQGRPLVATLEEARRRIAGPGAVRGPGGALAGRLRGPAQLRPGRGPDRRRAGPAAGLPAARPRAGRQDRPAWDRGETAGQRVLRTLHDMAAGRPAAPGPPAHRLPQIQGQEPLRADPGPGLRPGAGHARRPAGGGPGCRRPGPGCPCPCAGSTSACWTRGWTATRRPCATCSPAWPGMGAAWPGSAAAWSSARRDRDHYQVKLQRDWPALRTRRPSAARRSPPWCCAPCSPRSRPRPPASAEVLVAFGTDELTRGPARGPDPGRRPARPPGRGGPGAPVPARTGGHRPAKRAGGLPPGHDHPPPARGPGPPLHQGPARAPGPALWRAGLPDPCHGRVCPPGGGEDPPGPGPGRGLLHPGQGELRAALLPGPPRDPGAGHHRGVLPPDRRCPGQPGPDRDRRRPRGGQPPGPGGARLRQDPGGGPPLRLPVAGAAGGPARHPDALLQPQRRPGTAPPPGRPWWGTMPAG